MRFCLEPFSAELEDIVVLMTPQLSRKYVRIRKERYIRIKRTLEQRLNFVPRGKWCYWVKIMEKQDYNHR